MRAFLILLLLVTSIAASRAAEIGAIVVVKPNSIWFEDAVKLTEWQRLRKSSGTVAFMSYQKISLRASGFAVHQSAQRQNSRL